jgi:hypothetical protein
LDQVENSLRRRPTAQKKILESELGALEKAACVQDQHNRCCDQPKDERWKKRPFHL